MRFPSVISFTGALVNIPILTRTEIDGMREAGALTAQCMRHASEIIKIGVTTNQIDNRVREFCDEFKCTSAAYGYEGFPAYCCTSVNHVVAHGIPNDRKLQNGDIVKVDIALRTKDGWHGDMCQTFFIGKPSVKALLTVDATRSVLTDTIEEMGPDITTGDIGWSIFYRAKRFGYTVVQEYGGHGIGREFHMKPLIPNFGISGEGERLLPGMCITVEPMLNAGERYIKLLKDGSIVTRDRSLSAQFEHTILITDDGCEILTK